MNVEENIESIELSIKEAKEVIGLRDSLSKLLKGRDFKQVVSVGYFEKEASRLVLLKATPHMQAKEDQEFIDNSIIAIGYLRQYFATIMQRGQLASKALQDDEQTREELLTGE